jgi:4-hydroxy-tetrahydrodipicolinate reductase
MGQKLKEAIGASGSRYNFLGGSSLEATDYSKLDQAQIIFDFSSSAGNGSLQRLLAERPSAGYSLLIGSTGLPAERIQQWKEMARVKGLRLLLAPNTSLGVLVLAKAAMMAAPIAARHGFDVALVETHHKRKLDAPSGTANFLAESICASTADLKIEKNSEAPYHAKQLRMHSIRGGGVYGEHEIRLISETEEITLSHRALSRDLFASGALVMGEWLMGRSPGVYELLDIELSDLH